MKKNGFTLVELLAVIVLLGLIIVIVMTNGFGILDKAKGGINQIEEDNLIEAAKVFLVDVDNDIVTTGFDNSKIRVSCISGSCSYITINSNNVITRTSCTTPFCGTTVDVAYLVDKLYFGDGNNKCNKDAELKIRLEGDLEYTDYIVTNNGTRDICTKIDNPSIDYKLFKHLKEYLKKLTNNSATFPSSCSTINSFYTGCTVDVSQVIAASGFNKEGYSCSGYVKMQVFGRFNTTDYVVEKSNEEEVICSN